MEPKGFTLIPDDDDDDDDDGTDDNDMCIR